MHRDTSLGREEEEPHRATAQNDSESLPDAEANMKGDAGTKDSGQQPELEAATEGKQKNDSQLGVHTGLLGYAASPSLGRSFDSRSLRPAEKYDCTPSNNVSLEAEKKRVVGNFQACLNPFTLSPAEPTNSSFGSYASRRTFTGAASDGRSIKQEGGEGTKGYSSPLARATAASPLSPFVPAPFFAAASDCKATSVQTNGKEGREYTSPFGRYASESPFARFGTSNSAAAQSARAPSPLAKAHEEAVLTCKEGREYTSPFRRSITESPFGRFATPSSAAVHSTNAPSTFAMTHKEVVVAEEDSDEWEDVEDGDSDVDEGNEDDWEDIEDDE